MSRAVLADRPVASQRTLPTIARNLAILLIGSGLIALAAKVNVPVWPVPITLQTLALALIAALVGRRLAVGIVLTYLIQGLSGFPVFAGGGGLAYLSGPTAGFILGYLPMAYLIGWASDRGAINRPVVLLLAMLGADALLMLIGFCWLLTMAGSATWIDSSAPLLSAWRGAVEPFIVWDALKMALAAIVAWRIGSLTLAVRGSK